ncbi:MAG: hypothetical protein Q8R24_03555 [Legionellaceae bacterium]|nr:hypothetical protein [Legionellaceae bacterium]
MPILELYNLAQQSDERCIEYTGLSLKQFSELLPFFSTSVAKSLSNALKLFAICYVMEKKMTGNSIGKQLFKANYERDGSNFIRKAQCALEEAKAKASRARQTQRNVVIKNEIKPEITLKVEPVIKQEKIAPLGLSDTNSEYLLTHAPLNSSGDIYHILAYLILCTHFQKKIPKVMLTYDVSTTEKQANRAHNFAKSLSYSSFFHTENIGSNNAYHEVVRQSQLEKYIDAHYSNTVYVDQMATTTIIAQMFLRYGFKTITEILQRGFSKYDKHYFPQNAQQKVQQYVDDNLKQLKQHEENKPIVVLHIRYAKTANNHLNIPDDLVVKLVDFLNEKGYDAWCVLADDRKNQLPNYFSRYASRPFNTLVEVNGNDYTKFQHLQLMTAMAKNELIKGVIGNTSGTLDACAFVGNRVYNIHQFNDELSYQDLRFIMQVTFLSAEDLNKPDPNSDKNVTSEKIIKKALPNFLNWLVDREEKTPSIRYSKYSIPIMKTGFKKMYNVFMGKIAQPLPDIEKFLELITTTVKGEDNELIHQGKRF